MKTLALALASAVLIASPTLAQDTAPAAPEGTTSSPADLAPDANAPAAASTAGTTGGGMMMGDSSTATVKFATLSEADVMASKLEGIDVYNNQEENIGEIEDLVIKDGKTISGVVVSVGGFLGMGDRYVLLDPASIVLSKQDDGDLRAFVNTSKDELTNAPEFTYEDND
jgi:sporulation protein YlmC with PRC-barrel domain